VRVPRIKTPAGGVKAVELPWAEPNGGFSLLMERFFCRTGGACHSTYLSLGYNAMVLNVTPSLAQKMAILSFSVIVPSGAFGPGYC
jgi:hypothetical protein